MEIKTFVEGPIDANNYLIIDEKTKGSSKKNNKADRRGAWI